MTIEECYNKMHADYADAQKRMMKDSLIERFMLRFPQDQTMQQLRDATADGDQRSAFRAAHTLKGVAGNLSLAQLAQSASALTEQLRDGTQMPDKDLLATVEDDYALVVNTISQYQAEQA